MRTECTYWSLSDAFFFSLLHIIHTTPTQNPTKRMPNTMALSGPEVSTGASAADEVCANAEPAEDLLKMEGMDEGLAYELARCGVVTMEDLAEQSIDELLEIGNLDEARAGQLIMTARKPWFATEAKSSEDTSDA